MELSPFDVAAPLICAVVDEITLLDSGELLRFICHRQEYPDSGANAEDSTNGAIRRVSFEFIMCLNIFGNVVHDQNEGCLNGLEGGVTGKGPVKGEFGIKDLGEGAMSFSQLVMIFRT